MSYIIEKTRLNPQVNFQKVENLEIYTWENDLGHFSCGFSTKRKKKVTVFNYLKEESRESKIFDMIESELRSVRRKEEDKLRKAKMKKEALENIKVGDIYYTYFSYENTYVSFYQVTSLKGKKVGIRPIGKIVTKEDYMAQYIMPNVNDFQGEEKLVGFNSYGNLSNADGRSSASKTTPYKEHYISWGY